MSDELSTKLSSWIRDELKKRKIAITDVARKIPMKENTLRKTINGQRGWKLSCIKDLVRVLNEYGISLRIDPLLKTNVEETLEDVLKTTAYRLVAEDLFEQNRTLRLTIQDLFRITSKCQASGKTRERRKHCPKVHHMLSSSLALKN